MPNGPSSEHKEYDGFDLESLEDLVQYQDWVLSHFRKTVSDTVLELGAGSGTIANHLIKHSSKLILVEPSARHVELLNSKFSDYECVEISESTLEGYLSEASDSSIDNIIMVNVLEHIKDDNSAISQMLRVLRPGGNLNIMVPAMPFLMSKMDRRLGHFRRYRLQPLTSMVRAVGFQITDARYMDFFGILPWWIINTVAGQIEFNPALVRIYDRFFVPFGRWLECLIRPPVGKNIILVATRPS